MASHTNIESLQASFATEAEQASKEAAVRHALGRLDPKNDDPQQSYDGILRRLQAAITQELAARQAAPVPPPASPEEPADD
jgi:hypothetical protein